MFSRFHPFFRAPSMGASPTDRYVSSDFGCQRFFAKLKHSSFKKNSPKSKSHFFPIFVPSYFPTGRFKPPQAVGLLTRAVRHDDVGAPGVGHQLEVLRGRPDTDAHRAEGPVVLQGGLEEFCSMEVERKEMVGTMKWLNLTWFLTKMFELNWIQFCNLFLGDNVDKSSLRIILRRVKDVQSLKIWIHPVNSVFLQAFFIIPKNSCNDHYGAGEFFCWCYQSWPIFFSELRRFGSLPKSWVRTRPARHKWWEPPWAKTWRYILSRKSCGWKHGAVNFLVLLSLTPLKIWFQKGIFFPFSWWLLPLKMRTSSGPCTILYGTDQRTNNTHGVKKQENHNSSLGEFFELKWLGDESEISYFVMPQHYPNIG